MLLDTNIRDWVMIPIMLVMFLVGILRHYVTVILQHQPEHSVEDLENTTLLTRSRLLRMNASFVSTKGFYERKNYLIEQLSVLKKKDSNPMNDPKVMENLMQGMKSNMVMFIPQTIIMSWIQFFFSGFILTKLPFPLTPRFKSMLQRGIETSDMDVSWVSSLSWYFLNLLGMSSIFGLVLAAGGITDLKQQVVSGPNIDAIFKSEKEFLSVTEYHWKLEGVENRVLNLYSKDAKSKHV